MQPIVDVETMRACDAATIAGGVSGRELMWRAGEGILGAHEWTGKTAIVCGSGNNAGDGYVLALLLRERGKDVTLILLEERFSEDGRYYYDRCLDAGIERILYDSSIELSDYDTIVDCILGTGFRGDVTGRVAEAIHTINRSGKTVICADINSGLGGDNGQGALCVRSDLTVSVGTYKAGLFLGRAKEVIGARKNVDIGIAIPTPHAFLTAQSDFGEILTPRRADSHKGDYGYVCVMGGSREYAGAVKLANLSAVALRAGCGVSQLAVPEAIANAVAPHLLESTLLPIPSDETGHMQYCPDVLDGLLSRMQSIAVGMGWGSADSHAKILTHLLQNGSLSLVIDADGLNTLSRMELSILKTTACRVVLTPHLKEFERLSGIPIKEILNDPIRHAQAFAKTYGICLLLKGACTVVTDGEITLLVDRGCAGMATAGSGDVLSGILAGLLGYAPVSPLTVACGAYIAGLAGELAQEAVNPISVLASDTVAHVGAAISKMTEKKTV
ncbi:MAG: NAD(P)H-hydrate dehydratase [Clostridia bacterium]|nr:NAD(P)H-hydrate dehydratase [Clostridia bacterium]